MKEVRDACTESMTAISQSGVAHLIQNDLYEALSTFNGAVYKSVVRSRGPQEPQREVRRGCGEVHFRHAGGDAVALLCFA